MRVARLFAILMLSASASVFAAEAQAPAPRSSSGLAAELDEWVPKLLRAYATPGAAIGVIEAGKISHAGYYGHADAATLQPVTAATMFNVGSISKTVTAWGVMRLIEEERIGLDVPVNRQLRRWKVPSSAFDADQITVRRLLNHTAGLSMWGVPEFSPSDAVPSLEQMLDATTEGVRDIRLVRAPGERWEYSGGGYAILQLLIEEASEQDFAQYMSAAVLRPLGMTNSSFVWNAATTRASASPHRADGKPFAGQRFTATAAAGLQTTLNDMLAFALAGLKPSNDHTQVLSANAIRSMQASSKVSPAYGLGYELPELNGIPFVGHGGQNEGWMAQLLISPSTGDGLVVLTNGTNGLRIISEVQCQWMQRRFQQPCASFSQLPIDVPDVELQQLGGRYEDASGGQAILNVREGQLYWQTDYGYDFALRARSNEEFYWVIGQSYLTFERDEKRNVVAVIRHRGNEKTTFRKIR